MILRRNFQIQNNLRLKTSFRVTAHLLPKGTLLVKLSQIVSRGEKVCPGQVISDGQMDGLIILGRLQSGLLIRQLAWGKLILCTRQDRFQHPKSKSPSSSLLLCGSGCWRILNKYKTTRNEPPWSLDEIRRQRRSLWISVDRAQLKREPPLVQHSHWEVSLGP